MLSYYSATGVFDSVEPALVEVYGRRTEGESSTGGRYDEFELVID
jgi:hypothetical protein